MRPVEARYEDGLLRPAKPLALRPGERVGLIVVRRPDPARWDLARLAGNATEDSELAGAGIGNWAADLEKEDHG
jgi:predicted DNA-binding antitoxin AbrB/MazE fold protein